MIPTGWKEAPLSDLATIRRGAGSQYLNYVEQPEDGIRLIRIGDFLGNDPVYVQHSRHIERFILTAGDILIAGTGATAGIVFEVPDEFEGLAFSYNAPLIQVADQASKRYIYYVLTSNLVKRQQEALFTGNAQPFLDTKAIGGFRILLPKREERIRIAEVLETWDRAIATVEALISNARAQKQALMQQLLPHGTTPPRKRLPGFSGEWREAKLGSLADVSKGEQKGRATLAEEGPVPVINGGITPSGYTDHPNTAANTITISEGGNSCGHVDLITQPFWCGGHCYALKNLKVDRDYLFAVLKHWQPEIMSLRVGSGLPNIQKKALSQFSVPVPPTPEQERIGELAASADREIAALEAQLTALRQEKAALMQQLLTGKRRVKLPESEVA